MSYLRIVGLDHSVIPEEVARAEWDAWDDALRSGEREGAFILWRLDAHGWRTIPTIYKLIPEEIANAA